MTSYVNRRLGLGVAPGSYQLNAIGNILFSGAGSAAVTAKVVISGTVTGSGSTYGLNVSTSFDASTSTNYGIYSKPTFTGTSSITNAYNLYVDNSTKAAGTITNATGIYLVQPTSATTNKGLYLTGNTTGANDINFQIDTLFTPTATATLYASKISPSLSYSSGASTTSNFYVTAITPTINITSASQSTYSNFYNHYVNPTAVTLSGTNHTITNFYGIYSASPSPTLANSSTITNAYSGYFAAPGVGTNKVALWANDITLNTATAFAPLAVDTNKNVVSITTGISNAGYVLTSNGAGSLPTWQTSTGGVTSVTGTANQVSASPTTGAVTVSLPSSIITPGSLQTTNTLAVGGAVNTSYYLYVTGTPGTSSNTMYAQYIDNTITAASGASATTLSAIKTNVNLTTATSNVTPNLSILNLSATFTATAATINNAYGILLNTPTFTGTTTTAYGINNNVPTGATTNYGYYQTGTFTQSGDNGMQLSNTFTPTSAATNLYQQYINPTFNSSSNSIVNAYSKTSSPIFNVSANNMTNIYGNAVNPTINMTSTGTITAAYCEYITPTINITTTTTGTAINNFYGLNVTPAAPTITTAGVIVANYYGVYSGTMAAKTGSGNFTNAYGGYFLSPVTTATSGASIALYATNASFGTANTTTNPPANGILVQGNILNQALAVNSLVGTDGSKNLTTTTSGITASLASLTLTSALPVTSGGTGLNTCSLGDVFYGSGTNAITNLGGNITSTKKFLNQTGTGVVSAAPQWSALVTSDLGTTMTPQFTAIGLGTPYSTDAFLITSARTAGAVSNTYQIKVTGTTTGSSSSTLLAGVDISTTNAASGGILTNSVQLQITPNTDATTNTITNNYAMLINTGTNAAGTVTNNYGIANTTSGYGATLNIGYLQTGTYTKANDVSMKLNNTFTPAATATNYSLLNSPTMSITSGTVAMTNFYTNQNNPTINVTSATGAISFTGFYGLSVNPTSVTLSGAAHTLSTYYGIYSASPAATLANGSTITTAYSGYFATPGFGTTKVALWAADITLNAATAFAPLGADTNKNLVSLTTGISNAGYVLTSNGAGSLPTWQSATGGVTSVTGTANQVTASPTTGAVVVSLPSTIITPGSLQTTNTLAVGGAVNTSYYMYITGMPGVASNTMYAAYIDNTITAAAAVSATTLAAIKTNVNLTTAAGNTSSTASLLNLSGTFTGTAATISSAYGILLNTPTFTGTTTTAFGICNNTPVGASTNYGYYQTGSFTNAGDRGMYLENIFMPSLGNGVLPQFTSSPTFLTNNNFIDSAYAINVTPSFLISGVNGITNAYGINVLITENVNNPATLGASYGIKVGTVVGGSNSTPITNAYNMYLDGISASGSATITTGYGIYNSVPVGANQNYGYYQTGTLTKNNDYGMYLGNTFTPTSNGGSLYQFQCQPSFNTTTNTINSAFAAQIIPTFTIAGANALSGAYGLDVSVTDTINAASTLGSSYGIRVGIVANGSNAAAITNAYNMYLNGMTVSGSAVISTGYGIYNIIPTGAATNYGYYQTGTFTKVGDVGMQLANTFTPTANSGTLYQFYANPTFNSTTNTITAVYGSLMNVTVNCTNTISNAYTSSITPTFTVSSTGTMTGAYGQYIAPTVNVTTATVGTAISAVYGVNVTPAAPTITTASVLITNYYGVYTGTMGAKTGSGNFSYAYGGYFSNPVTTATATGSVALWADSFQIGGTPSGSIASGTAYITGTMTLNGTPTIKVPTSFTVQNTSSTRVITVSSTASTDIQIGVSAGQTTAGTLKNVFIGESADTSITSGQYNVAVGYQALLSNSTINGNTAVGYQAGYTNANGVGTTAIGYQAGFLINVASANFTGVGYSAGANCTGVDCTFIGYESALSLGTGARNTSVGSGAARATGGATASDVTAIGYHAGYSLTTGNGSTLIGSYAGQSLTSGLNNIAIGYQSQNANSTNGVCIGIGYQALYTNNSAAGLIAIGYQAGYSINAASANFTGLGYQAGYSVTGVDCTYMGYSAGKNLTSGANNTCVGSQAGYASGLSFTAGNLTAVGYRAGYAITTGNQNTLIGSQAGIAVTSGIAHVAIGYNALFSCTTSLNVTAVGSTAGYLCNANNCTYLGTGAGYNMATGNNNTCVGAYAGQGSASNATEDTTAIGSYAGGSLNGGIRNTLVGSAAGASITTGNDGVAVGWQALYSAQTFGGCVAIGFQALRTNNSAYYLTAVGSLAGYSMNTASANFTAVGYQAGYSATGVDCTYIGYLAGKNLTSGTQNTCLGTFAGTGTTTYTANNLTSIGYKSGFNISTGTCNTLVGSQSGQAMTTASSNVAVGYQALNANTINNNCTAIGYQALYSNTVSDNLTAVGYQAGYSMTGPDGTAIGYNAGMNSTGNDCTYVGYGAGRNLTSGSNNACFGSQAGWSLSLFTARDLTAMGFRAGYAITTGFYNTLVGSQAAQALTTASNNVAVGYQALNANTTIDSLTAVGYQAGYATTGTAGVFVGMQAGANLTSGNFNTCIGMQAGYSSGLSHTAADLTAIGNQAGFGITTGGQNTLVGSVAGSSLTTGSANVAVGYQAQNANATFGNCVAVGYRALLTNNSAAGLTAVGYQAGYSINAASANFTGLGYQAGYSCTGADCTYIGFNAGQNLTSGTQNTCVGSQAGAGATTFTAGDLTAVGFKAGYAITTGISNTLMGSSAGVALTSGGYNVAIGHQALWGSTTYNGSVAIGFQTLYSNNAAAGLTAVGYQAGLSINTASANFTGLGYQAGLAATGVDCTYVGYSAGRSLTSGTQNTCVGSQAGRATGITFTAGNLTAVGYRAGYNITTGNYNTLVGSQSGLALTTGSNNIAIGYLSQSANATNDSCTAVGYFALLNNNSAAGLTAVGYRAGYSINTASSNFTGVGYQAGNSCTGVDCTYIGYSAGQNLTNGIQNTCLGSQAGYASGILFTASQMTMIGYKAGYAITSGDGNTFIGSEAGSAVSTGAYNVAIGCQAMYPNTTQSNCTVIGYQAAYNNNSAGGLTAIGYRAGYTINTASSNLTVVGYQAGYSATGVDCTYLGYNAGRNLTSGINNTCIGSQAGTGATTFTAGDLTAIGFKAGYAITTGNYNILVGSQAGIALTTGGGNVSIGYQSMYSGVGIGNCVAIGYQAAYSNVNGGNVTAVGFQAGFRSNVANSNLTALGYSAASECTGLDCIFIGHQSGSGAASGNNNTFIGSMSAVVGIGTSSDNTTLGYRTGYKMQNVTQNTLIGSGAGSELMNGSGNVFIGYQAGGGVSGGSSTNKLYIANSSTITPLIYGDFSAATLTINSSLGVGVAASTTAGTIYANTAIGVGVSPPNTAGYAQINARLGLATAPSATSGFINAVSFTGAAVSYYGEQLTNSFNYSSASITQSSIIFIDGTSANLTTSGGTISTVGAGVINNVKMVNTSGTFANMYGYYSLPSITATTAITKFASIYLDTPSITTGTNVPNAYGIYNNVPTGAVINTGYYQTGTFTKTGDIGLKLDNVFTPSTAATNLYQQQLTPVFNTSTGSVTITNAYGSSIEPSFVPTTNTTTPGTFTTIYSAAVKPTINIANAQTTALTIGTVYGQYIGASAVTLGGSTSHRITNWYGLYVASIPTVGGTTPGKIGTAYGGYFATPLTTTTDAVTGSVALWADSLQIGGSVTTVATVGSGNVNFGSASISASSLLATDGSKNLTTTISGLSPTFTGLTLSGATANTLTYFNGSKALSSVTLTANLTLTTGTLDTVQGIQTTSNPQFNSIGIGVAAPVTAGYAQINTRLGVAISPAYPLDITGQARISTQVAIAGATPSANIGLGNSFTLANAGGTNSYGEYIASSITTTSGTTSIIASLGINSTIVNSPATTTTTAAGLLVTPSITNSTVSSNITNPTGIYLKPTFTGTVTLTNVYGALIDTITSGGGTLTNAYGSYIKVPTAGGTSNVALYADNIAIGTAATSPPTNGLLVLGNIQNTALTASSLVATDASKNLTSTISGLSPTFTGLTLSGATANTLTYFNGSKALSSVTLTANLTLTTGTLDTVQGIQTTSTPQFAGLGISAAANSLYGIYNHVTVASIGTSAYAAYYSDGTYTLSTAVTNNLVYGANLSNTYICNQASATLDQVKHVYLKPTFTNTSGTFNIVTTLSIESPTITGTISSAYGILNSVPTGAGFNCGYYQTGTFAKVNDIGMHLSNTFNPTVGGQTTYQFYVVPRFSTVSASIANAYAASITSTFTISAANALDNAFGLNVAVTDTINAGATLGASYGIRVGTVANGTNPTAITNAYNMYLNGMTTAGSAVITTGYGIYNSSPTGAGTNYGYYQTGTFTKASDIGFQLNNSFTPTATATTLYQQYVNATFSAASALIISAYADAINATFTCGAANNFTNAYASAITPTFTVSSTGMMTTAMCQYISPTVNVTTATTGTMMSAVYGINITAAAPTITTASTIVTNYYGIYCGTMAAKTGSGNFANAYSAYFSLPVTTATTTSSMALYATNASFGVGNVAISPPTNGILVQGNILNQALSPLSLVGTDASKNLTSTTSGITPTFAGLNLTAALTVANGGTGLTSCALGNVPYGNGTNSMTLLPGNTSTSRLFFTQTGDGVNSAAPAWSAIAASDFGTTLSPQFTSIGLGTAAINEAFLVTSSRTATSAATTWHIRATGTTTGSSTATLLTAIGCDVINKSSGATLANAAQINLTPNVDATSNIITNSSALLISAGTNVAGTVTNSYGIYNNISTFATNNFGYYQTGTFIKSTDDGMILNDIFSPTTTASLLTELSLTSTYNPTSGPYTVTSFMTQSITPTILKTSASVITTTAFYNLNINPSSIAMSGAAHTINDMYNIYSAIPAPTLANSSTITRAYSGYFVNPSAGTSSVALYADSALIGGSTVTTAMTAGTFKIGTLGAGVICAPSSLGVSATSGFLYIPSLPGGTSGNVGPTGTPTTQAGTIPMAYDTDNNQLFLYNGAWRGVGECLIRKYTVSGTTTGTVSFTSIPQNFNRLKIVIIGQIISAAVQYVLMRFNGISTATYDYQQLYGNNAGAAALNGLAQTSFRLSWLVGDTLTASKPGQVTVEIPEYVSTNWYKSYIAYGGCAPAVAASSFSSVFTGSNRATTAITQIDIIADGGLNFKANTVIYLYGMM